MNDRFEKAFLLVPDIKEPENKYMFVITIENFIYMSFKTKKKVYLLFLLLGMDFIDQWHHTCWNFAFRNKNISE